MTEEAGSRAMDAPNAWNITPLRSKVIFLLAVFFMFVGISVANDVIDGGRVPPVRYVVMAVLTGLFAVCYATGGIVLRRRFWKLFVPLLIFQFFCMAMLGHLYPDVTRAVAAAHLENRLALDGTLIIFSVSLGYAGFVYASIAVGKRWMQSQLGKAALESEMAAAREVQRVMVPEVAPRIPGYDVESVYRPAAEVGGDFFQVIPLKSGRTLVVIGDVSGKGLRAAMIVSMIVGMLRAVSGFTEDPAEILGELNRRLCGRTQGSFATCLAVRLEDDGKVTMANAGHPAPYLDGAEMAMAGAMPLGMTEDAVYANVSQDLRAGDRTVMLTDGIPEAQNARGELLGFSRVERLLRGGATPKEIADAALEHGQNDDVTVIGIARRG